MSYAERHVQQSSQDLASLHHTFTQYCRWLETLGEEYLPTGSPSPSNVIGDGTRSSAFPDGDKFFASHFDGHLLGTFAPFGLATPTSNETSPTTAGSDQGDFMTDLNVEDLVADTIDTFSACLPGLQDLDITFRSSSSSSIADGHPQKTAQDQAVMSPNQCCFALADKTLKSLHIPSTACLSTMREVSFISKSRPNAPRTANSVLSGNKEAMLALSKMLRCSCSLTTQLQLVMATICDKLVMWYHAMVQGEQSFGDHASTSYPKLRGGDHSRDKARISCLPIPIEISSLDGAVEAHITGRVVLAHLRAMDFLVLALSKRIEDASLQSSSSRHGEVQHSSSPLDESNLFGIIRDGLITRFLGQLEGAREDAARLMDE